MESVDGRGIGAPEGKSSATSEGALESEPQGQRGITNRGSIAIERSWVIDPTLLNSRMPAATALKVQSAAERIQGWRTES